MKKFALFIVSASILLIPSFSVHAGYVHGYTRSNGTYVQGYYRTTADGNPYNNYSFPGNYNPNTGKITGGSASTYLNNYYKSSSTYSPSYSPSSVDTYSYPTTPSCPLNSYANGTTCKCIYGYVSNGTSCVSGNSLCYTQTGIMSSYDVATNSCKCMSGYAIGVSGQCEYQSAYSYTSSSSGLSNSNCPAHSSQSVTDSNKCSCNAGYQPNSAKNQCVLIPVKSNDQLCEDSFGNASKWTGNINSGGLPTCACQTGYQWNTDQTSCVRK